jgi:type IV secretion system protein VirB9
MLYAGVVLLGVVGCAPKAPPLPPVPAMPDDLSPAIWAAPEVVNIPPPAEAPPEPPPVRPAARNEKLYAYEPQQEYLVPIRIGTPGDIVLEPGEIVHAISTGDRSPLAEGEAPRWTIKEGVSESEYTPIAHIFITATHPGLQQGMVVTTSRRTYHLHVKSVEKSPIRTVRWTYPPAPLKPVKNDLPLLPDGSTTQHYHIGYAIEGPESPPDWLPRQVLDDGKKTYILFSPVVLYQDAPLLRLVGPNGPEVVNVRQVHTVYVIDRLISHAELRVGVGEHAVIVTIRRDAVQRINCPGHAACPQWPDRLATRHAAGGPPR